MVRQRIAMASDTLDFNKFGRELIDVHKTNDLQ